MADYLIQDTTLTAIADAIRAKNGGGDTYTPAQMAAAISKIETDGTGGGETVWFDDRNDSVQAYLAASESYTDANRASVSVIGTYADTSVQDQDCPKSFLGAYNLAPGAANTVGDWTVTTLGEAPRMLKLDGVWNARDCGGWSADGGRVKYGMLFRGARISGASSDDLALLAAVGIRLELDIRDASNAEHQKQIPGSTYRNVAISNAYAQMITGEAAAAANACIAAMESVVDDKPVYIHCASGADRTGCICAMLEALLGMRGPDLDRDFELTCFADVENLTGHTRSGGSWTGFWSALDGGQGSAKMNVAKFLRDHGATTALINAFRRKMIDGSPSDVDLPTYSVTNSLTGCASSNGAASVDSGAAYSAVITPNSGYAMTLLTVTMGGTDITASAVSGGTVSIPAVTGAVVITALAEPITSYTNLVRQAVEVGSAAVYNGGLGYKNGYYLDSGSGAESANASDCMTGCIPYTITTTQQPTDVLYIKGYTGAAGASHTRMTMRREDKTRAYNFNGFLSSNTYFDVETLGTGYYRLTPKSNIHHSIGASNIGYLQFSFNQPDGSGVIITRNEAIG